MGRGAGERYGMGVVEEVGGGGVWLIKRYGGGVLVKDTEWGWLRKSGGGGGMVDKKIWGGVFEEVEWGAGN